MQRFCERCDEMVEAAYDEPRFRKWVKGYFCLGIPFIPAMPIIGSDMFVMIPLTLLYLLGFGPALGILREPPKCGVCGAAVSHRPELPAAAVDLHAPPAVYR